MVFVVSLYVMRVIRALLVGAVAVAVGLNDCFSSDCLLSIHTPSSATTHRSMRSSSTITRDSLQLELAVAFIESASLRNHKVIVSMR